ncbi:MAG: LssY C-terminal domain-containing protein [Nevskiales bacterium]|nr:LssY C-terminal domain-containing protein [Nevskiales bacterium]
MIETLQSSLEWINAHPHWALLLLLVVSLLDSIFIVGMFVPAGVALFAGGALVALGSIELWQAIVLATGGAVAGDTLSYWLGRHYGERLFATRFLGRHPDIVVNGRQFLCRYGAFSIALARFLGPMRAIVPALSGAAGLRLATFVVADVASATLWAFVFVLPGVVFGASLGLAAEVAGRLALLLLGLLIVLAAAVWLTVLSIRVIQNHAEAWIVRMLDWSRRHRRLGKFGMALADPMQPETPVLAILATLLLAISGVWLWLFAGPTLHPYPWALDAAVFQSMRDLHTPWGLALAQRILQIGQWSVYGPVALVTFACLAGLRKPRAAAHWLAALGFGALLSLGLYAIPTLPAPHVFFHTPPPARFSERDLVLATVVYAFLPVLLTTGRDSAARFTFYGASTVILLLIVLARLYLGAQWFSLALYSTFVGLLWAALLALGYRRHRPERIETAKVLTPVMIAFVGGCLFVVSRPYPVPVSISATEPTLTLEQWRIEGWHHLPRQRIDIAGRDKQPLQLQWAGDLADIRTALQAADWTALPPLSGGNVLRWLTDASGVADLPVLPQVHAGHNPSLSARRVIGAEEEDLLRLWPAGARLADGRPIWVGSITRLQAQTLYRLLTYPAAAPMAVDVDAALAGLAAAGELRIENRDTVRLIFSAPPRSND